MLRTLIVLGVPFTLGCAASTDDLADRARASEIATGRIGVAAPTSHIDDLDAEIWNRLVNGLELDEAVSLALLNDGTLRAKFEAIGVSRADVAQSQLFHNPSLALSFKFPTAGGPVDVTANLAQQVADFWQIPVRRSLAENQLESAILDAAITALDVATRARSAAYHALAAREMLGILDGNFELANRSVAFAETQFRAGEVSEFDVNLARATAIDVEEERIRARGDFALAQADLRQALGIASRSDEIDLRVAWPEFASIEDANVLVMRAIERRLEMREVALKVERQEIELKLAQQSLWSSLEVGAEYEGAGPDRAIGPTLGFELPIFDQKQAAIARARFALAESREQQRARREAIAAEVRRAQSQVVTTSAMLEFHSSQSLPRAQALVDGAEQRYRAGEESVLALIEAQESLGSRRRAAVLAARDHALALVELERALGGR